MKGKDLDEYSNFIIKFSQENPSRVIEKIKIIINTTKNCYVKIKNK